MKKILIWIACVILLGMPVLGSVQVQYSIDNTTWKDVYYLNETGKEAFQINLHTETLYYFRGMRDIDTNWTYISQQTGGETMSVSFMIGVGIICFLMFFLAYKLEDEHFILKLFLIITSVTFLLFIAKASINITILGNTGFLLYKGFLWFYRVFWFYIIGFTIYKILLYKGLIGGKN